MFEAIPLSLYVHVPWCVRKCPYCDFNSHAAPAELPQERYLAALLSDLESELPRVWGRGLDSIFIGGGTPSLLAAESVDALLAGIRARLRTRPDCEVTLEANPGTLERGRFAAYRAAGVNRLSIGAQSFDDRALAALGRIHDSGDVIAAFESARAAGFERINLDLMFGLPGQDLDAALADLRTACALQPDHLSWYQLTLEPNTPFHHSPPALPEDDRVAEIQAAGLDLLAQAGYSRYEVSAYARPGQACRHNRHYWEFGDYLGIGAGAHGKLSRPAGAGLDISRRHKPRGPEAYLAEPGRAAGEREVEAAERPLEFLMNALRLVEGVAAELYPARTGLDLRELEPALDAARARGLLDPDPARLRATPQGLVFLNELLGEFL